MSIIILLIVASLTVATIFLVLFLWAVKTNQYKDIHTPALRILNDDKSENNI